MNRPPSQWVNAEPDAGLPHALLERLAQRVPVGTIEEIWLFPTRRIAAGESTIFVVAAFEPEPEQRRVITARYTVSRDRRGTATVQERIDEHGTAPAAALTRIVNGVLHRMDEEGEQQPRAERIERDPGRWWTLVEDLGGQRPTAATPDQARPEASGQTAPGAAAHGARSDAIDGANQPDAIDGANEIGYQ